MDTVEQTFLHGQFQVSGMRRHTPRNLLAVLIRVCRQGAAAIHSFGGSIKEILDAANLRAAAIDRQINNAKRDAEALSFGCHRLF